MRGRPERVQTGLSGCAAGAGGREPGARGSGRGVWGLGAGKQGSGVRDRGSGTAGNRDWGLGTGFGAASRFGVVAGSRLGGGVTAFCKFLSSQVSSEAGSMYFLSFVTSCTKPLVAPLYPRH